MRAAFDQSAQQYLDTGLKQYNGLIADIKAKYSGTPVGATESIFAYMSPSLGLNLITPPSYMNAVSEGTDISAADEATVEQQINQKQIKILVYNSQNTPPNIQILLDKCQDSGHTDADRYRDHGTGDSDLPGLAISPTARNRRCAEASDGK